AVARLAMIGRGGKIGNLLLHRELWHVDELTGVIVGPAVIAANDQPVPAPALGQFGSAMAAAVLQCRGLTVRAEKQHDVLAEQTKRFRTILEVVERNDRVPEPPQDFLLRRQHPVSSERIAFVEFRLPSRPRCRATPRARASTGLPSPGTRRCLPR